MSKIKKRIVGNKIIDAQGRTHSFESYNNSMEYRRKYNAKRYKMYGIRLFKEEDADIIEKLDKMKSINGYVRQLIIEDLKNNAPAD